MSSQDPVAEESILDLFEDDGPDSSEPSGPDGGDPDAPETADDEARRKRRRLLAWLLALALVLAAALLAWYLLNRKPLSELPGTQLHALPTYKTSIYGIEQPLGVAVTPDGATIFATHGGLTAGVTMFDRDGRTLRELEMPGDAPKHVPVYLTVAPNGKLYVGDRQAGAVYIYAANGDFIERFVVQDATVEFSPLGVAVAADGTVYVADVMSQTPADHRILQFDASGKLVRTLGAGELNYPNQLHVDADGALYATDSNNGRLIVFAPDGQRSTLVARGVGSGDLGLPRGFGIDDRGRIFVVDTTDHMVRMYVKGENLTDHPEFAGSFGDMGVEDGHFQYPNGLDVDARSCIYITDRENNRVQVWGF